MANKIQLFEYQYRYKLNSISPENIVSVNKVWRIFGDSFIVVLKT